MPIFFFVPQDNIPDPVIAKIQPFMENEEFTPAAIAKASKACTSICQWVRAMHKYHFVAKNVAPKRVSVSCFHINFHYFHGEDKFLFIGYEYNGTFTLE